MENVKKQNPRNQGIASIFWEFETFLEQKGISRKKTRISLVLFFFVLVLFLPLPVNWAVDPLLKKNAPELYQNLHWESSRFSFAGGLRLYDAKLEPPSNMTQAVDSLSLEVEKIGVRFEYLALLTMQVKVKALHLQNVTIHTQDQLNELAKKMPPLAPLGILTLLEPISTEDFRLTLNEIEVKDRSNDQSLALLEQLHLECDHCVEPGGEYELELEQATLHPLPPVEDIQLEGTLKKDVLHLSKLKAEFCDGDISGSGNIPLHPKKMMDLKISFENIETLDIFKALMHENTKLEGELSGTLNLSGSLTSVSQVSGFGSAKLEDVWISGLPVQSTAFFQEFAPGFDRLEFDEIKIDTLSVHKNALRFRDLKAKSKRLEFQSQGFLNLDGTMRLQIEGTMPGEEVQKLPVLTQMAVKNFNDSTGTGNFGVVISGTLDKQVLTPTGDQVGKAVGNQLQELGRGLKRLFQ